MQKNDPIFDSVKSDEFDNSVNFMYFKRNGDVETFTPEDLKKAFE